MNTIFKGVALVMVVGISCASFAQDDSSGERSLKQFDSKVNALLKQMTLEEKVGQMTQVTIDVVSRSADGRSGPHNLDSAKLEKAILDYHVGSIINVGQSSFTLGHWTDVITAIQDVAIKKTRLHIPILYGIDAIHGATYTQGATLFPQAIGVAATWNTEFARRIGEITAYEVRASGIPWNFNPVLDIGRQPLWPRLWETYGEDVYLGTTLGTAYEEGLMGESIAARDKVAPCLKHFAGYSMPFSGKDRTPAWIDERMLREYFLPAFEAGVKAGVPTVMANSSEISGIPGHANYHLLTEILKQEWAFEGFVVSDWQDIERLFIRDHVADSPKEAVRQAVMAGIDMSMVPLDYSFYDLLLELVKENAVPEARIDDAVRRILRVKYAVGLFDRPYPDSSLTKGFASAEFTRFNRSVAQESITLLKNAGGLLPLRKNVRVLVTGPTANVLSSLNSGWTITWQGNEESLYPKDKPTILKAITERLGEGNVSYIPGSDFSASLNVSEAAAAARSCDVVVACLGEKAYCEIPGNLDDLTLDEAQLELVERLAETGKPIILVLAEGRPRIIHRIVDKANAILMAYLPGMEGGAAIADVLFGDAIPSGKLPVTYPKYPNSLGTYDCKPLEVADGNSYDPEFPFGFGLSYANFEYTDLRLSETTMSMNGKIGISVTVSNTGPVAAKEVVQLYVSDLFRSVSPPVKELRGFKKVRLNPGENTTILFTLTLADLSFIGRENKRVAEKGRFKVAIGNLTGEFELR
jgi:beta-glucosidase